MYLKKYLVNQYKQLNNHILNIKKNKNIDFIQYIYYLCIKCYYSHFSVWKEEQKWNDEFNNIDNHSSKT